MRIGPGRFEDTVAFPFTGRIIGADILVEGWTTRETTSGASLAICRRDGQRDTVSLLDISLADPVNPETAQLLAAYRRWAGADPPPRRRR